MDVSAALPGTLDEVRTQAERLDSLGVDLLTVDDTAHEPFLRLAIGAEHSRRASLAPSVAIAFGRSPWVVAQQAWELQRFSGGRFRLGLGTQVKAHIEQRFSMPWSAPGPRLREFVLAVKAIWDVWQGAGSPDFRGDSYQFTRMNPGSNPGPIAHPRIPILLAAVNPYNAALAGELGDGLFLHPFSTPRYIREVVLPALERGARKAGRGLDEMQVWGGGMIATGPDEESVSRRREWARSRIAYYGSTPAYRPVLRLHGWDDLGARLHQLAREREWEVMTRLIPDEVVDEFVIAAVWEDLPAALVERRAGTLTGIAFSPDGDEVRLERALRALRDAPGRLEPR